MVHNSMKHVNAYYKKNYEKLISLNFKSLVQFVK